MSDSNYSKEKFAVGMMNAFDFNQSQTVFVAAQSEAIRAKYDYIFKVKILDFYLGRGISLDDIAVANPE